MLPVFLSCEIKSMSSVGHEWEGGTRNPYFGVASMWAGGAQNVEVLKENPEEKRGPFFSWNEKIRATFGESVWYRDIDPVTLTSRRAIGILNSSPWRDSTTGLPEILITVVSALPSVTTTLSDSIPRVLEKQIGKEIIHKTVRLKLADFLDRNYERIQDQLIFIKYLNESGQVVTIQREHKSPVAKPPPERLKRWVESEYKAETEPVPGLLAVGLRQEHSSWVVSRTFSVEISDVASKFDEIAFTLGEITELLRPYLQSE